MLQLLFNKFVDLLSFQHEAAEIVALRYRQKTILVLISELIAGYHSFKDILLVLHDLCLVHQFFRELAHGLFLLCGSIYLRLWKVLQLF